MPRIARKNMTMPFFHLMTQGINKEYIFENNSEKVEYEKLILLQKKELNVNILAYCIMDNHAHILIRVKEVENMSNFMHKINSQYATYYNKKHHRTGYVFKNRYKSQMINSLKHLYRCIDYIHDNPVKAGICETREQYKFSSYSNLYQNNQIKAIKSLEKQLKESFINESKNVEVDETKTNYDDENMIFLEDTYEDKKSICEHEIKKYMKEKQIDKLNLLEDRENLKKLVDRLRTKNISYRIMAEHLGIGRETLRKLNLELNK